MKPDYALDRAKRGLCAVIGCETPPVVKNEWGELWCEPHDKVIKAQNEPVKGRGTG